MVPCNLVAEEILTDHPARYRAMIVESANPAHSTADSKKFIEAMERLECTVVIDIAMTETQNMQIIFYQLQRNMRKQKYFFNFEFPTIIFI